jgi:AraC-like DNA-binding protein
VAAGRRGQHDNRVLLPQPTGSGVLRPWPAVLVTWGPGSRSDLHAHHCWHLLLALDGDLHVTAGSDAAPRAVGALLTAPDLPHAVDASAARVVLVFVAPESEAGARLRAAHGARAVVATPPEGVARLRQLLSPEALAREDAEDAVARALGAGGARIRVPAGSHPAVRRVLRWLSEAPPDAETSLEALARRAGLSPGRFMHAFTGMVGIPLRPYLLWLKLQRAGAALARGASPSSAAAAAGFADAAHMTRTFRRMFGVTPSGLRRSGTGTGIGIGIGIEGSHSVQDG